MITPPQICWHMTATAVTPPVVVCSYCISTTIVTNTTTITPTTVTRVVIATGVVIATRVVVASFIVTIITVIAIVVAMVVGECTGWFLFKVELERIDPLSIILSSVTLWLHRTKEPVTELRVIVGR